MYEGLEYSVVGSVILDRHLDPPIAVPTALQAATARPASTESPESVPRLAALSKGKHRQGTLPDLAATGASC